MMNLKNEQNNRQVRQDAQRTPLRLTQPKLYYEHDMQFTDLKTQYEGTRPLPPVKNTPQGGKSLRTLAYFAVEPLVLNYDLKWNS